MDEVPADSSSLDEDGGRTTTRRDRAGVTYLDSAGLAALVCTTALVGVMLPFWPGLIHADSNQTIWEASAGVYEDWWSPFLTVVWDGLIALGPGVAAVFVLQVALMVGGLYLTLRIALRRVPAALATCVVCAFPPVYGQLATISRDTYYIGLTLLGFGLLGVSLRRSGCQRALAVGGSMCAVVVAYLSRQNALGTVSIVAGVVTFVVISDPNWRPDAFRLPRRMESWPWRLVLATVVAVCVSLGVLVGTGFVYQRTNVLAVHPERPWLIYDLAAISTQVDQNEFPRGLTALGSRCCVTPADTTLSTLEARFDYTNVITLWPDGNPLTGDFRNEGLAAAEARLLREAWWNAVSEHPFAYLRARARLLGSQLGLSRPPMDAYVGMTEPSNFGHPLEFSRGYDAATSYITTFVSPHATIPLDRAWIYLLVATGSAVFLLRRRPAAWLPIIVMVAAVWVNIGVLAFFSMSAGFRYVALLVPVALVLAIFSVATMPPLRFMLRCVDQDVVTEGS